jgi:membrane protein YqaA with SNARE-associated domain
MSATSHGAGCGVVLGIVLVVLFQQLGYLDLSDLVPTLEYLILGGVIGGVLGALIGWALGRSYLSRHAADQPTAGK